MNSKFKLSFPQENIFLVEKMNSNSSINMITAILNINNIFDEKYCKYSINRLFNDNDLLRAKIMEENNIHYQFIQDFEEQDIEIKDFTVYSKNDINEYILEFSNKPISIKSRYLCEVKILKYSNNCGAILFKIHHIIADAWSIYKIGTLLRKYYNEVLYGIQENDTYSENYFDYIVTEYEYRESEKYENDKMFWHEYLQGMDNVIDLKEKSITTSTKANRYSTNIDLELNNYIDDYCKNNNISKYSLLLGVISIYIHNLKNENDITIGTPLLNRSNFKEKNMLGMFVSTFPFRIKIKDNPKVVDFLKEISLNTKSMLKHQKYPYYKILEEIHSETNIKDKLYNIVLSFQNGKVNFQDQNFKVDWAFSGNIQNTLEIHVLDPNNSGILTINYDYLIDLFEEKDIFYLNKRLMNIISLIVKDEYIKVEDIDLFDEEERSLIYSINNTTLHYQKDENFMKLFKEQVDKNPNKVAIVFKDKNISYNELDVQSNKLAYYLREKIGVSRNDIVSIITNRGIEMLVSIVAILKSRSCIFTY